MGCDRGWGNNGSGVGLGFVCMGFVSRRFSQYPLRCIEHEDTLDHIFPECRFLSMLFFAIYILIVDPKEEESERFYLDDTYVDAPL